MTMSRSKFKTYQKPTDWIRSHSIRSHTDSALFQFKQKPNNLINSINYRLISSPSLSSTSMSFWPSAISTRCFKQRRHSSSSLSFLSSSSPLIWITVQIICLLLIAILQNSHALQQQVKNDRSVNTTRTASRTIHSRQQASGSGRNSAVSTTTNGSSGTLSAFGIAFDPKVSAKCERNLMHIAILSSQPFNGIIHVRNYRRNPCQTYGNGSLVTTLTIDLLAQSNQPTYCGVHRAKASEERSISLVVRLHRALELSDDKHFVITCGNTEFVNKNKHEKLMFKFVDSHGHKISKLYHGEAYRLRAEIISSQDSLMSASSAGSIPSSKTPSYHLYVKKCLIFNGNETDIEFLDANGCPKLNSVTSFKQIGHNIAEAEIKSMFKLPGTNQLHLQCVVEAVESCHFCEPSLCMRNETRKGKHLLLEPIDMQMLASTTAYVFEPDQLMSANIVSQTSPCSEWRFPWLIALCIMLGVLLIIMMVVNIFLCTSMSCSCFKTEVVEREPTIIEDYDPYKIDVGGFYSPYDSRLSLNRNYPTASMVSANDSEHHFFPSGTTGGHHHHQQQPQSHPHQLASHHHLMQQQQQHQQQSAAAHSTHPMLLSSYSPVDSYSTSRPRRSSQSQQTRTKYGHSNSPPQHLRLAGQSHPHQQQQQQNHHSPNSNRSQEFY